MGEKAKKVSGVFKNKIIIKSRHLGFNGINHIDKDICGKDISENAKSTDRTKARLEVVAEDIIRQIQKND